MITGCSAGADGVLRATNKLKKKLFLPLKDKELSELTDKEIKSLYGRVHSMRFVEQKSLVDLKRKIEEIL